jgi:hypothetical protein
MQSRLKRAPAAIPRQSEDAIERRTRAHILDTADAARAEKRRLSYATIDSSAGKWRYSAAPPKA